MCPAETDEAMQRKTAPADRVIDLLKGIDRVAGLMSMQREMTDGPANAQKLMASAVRRL